MLYTCDLCKASTPNVYHDTGVIKTLIYNNIVCEDCIKKAKYEINKFAVHFPYVHPFNSYGRCSELFNHCDVIEYSSARNDSEYTSDFCIDDIKERKIARRSMYYYKSKMKKELKERLENSINTYTELSNDNTVVIMQNILLSKVIRKLNKEVKSSIISSQIMKKYFPERLTV